MSVAKKTIARAAANPSTGRLLARVLRDRISSRGISVNTDSALFRDEVKAYLALGMYESSERRLVVRCLCRNVPVVELGASIGYITGHISRLRPPCQIAVEADPRLLPLIQNLLDANRLPPVRLLHAAIDYSGLSTVRFHAGSSNITGGVVNQTVGPNASMEFIVPALTLADVLRREGIDRFALVCDIEGAERAMIMRETAPAIDACQQMIIELHAGDYDGRHWSTPELAHAIVERWGMKAVRRDGSNWVFQR